MTEQDDQRPPIDLGSRLRDLRTERNLSLRAVARHSGLSTNALSLIERNLTSPSVSTLYKIAKALDVPITAFFHPKATQQTIVYQKRQEHEKLEFLRGVWVGLGGENFIGEVEPFLLTLEPGGGSGRYKMVHSGHEFVYCLEGKIEYEVDDQRFILESGDSLLFSAHLSHRWRNPTSEPCRVLILISGFSSNENLAQHRVPRSDEDDR